MHIYNDFCFFPLLKFMSFFLDDMSCWILIFLESLQFFWLVRSASCDMEQGTWLEVYVWTLYLVVFPFCSLYYGWGLCWVVGVKTLLCIGQSLFWDLGSTLQVMACSIMQCAQNLDYFELAKFKSWNKSLKFITVICHCIMQHALKWSVQPF